MKRDFHWIITIQALTLNKIFTLEGVSSVGPTLTRSDVYNGIYHQARQQLGDDTLIVLFFSLEPNHINA